MVKGSSRKTRKPNLPKNRTSSSRDKDNTPGASQSALKHDVLIDLPLDILCEIFKLLPPLDLLQIARTAKSFRKFLMNRASKSIWTHVLSAVEDLPPCPDDLSGPQYAYLMFTNHCHKHELSYVGLVASNSAYWVSFFECILSYLVRTKRSFKRWQELPEKIGLALAEFVPATTNRLTKVELQGPYYKRGGSLEPQDVKDKRTRFHVKTALVLHADYKKIKGAKAKKAWMEEQRKIWVAKEKVHIRIRQKLRVLGWAEEVDQAQALPYEAFGWGHPAKELTDEEWGSMKESMVAAMEIRRETRFKTKARHLLQDRIDIWVKPAYTSLLFSHPPNTVIPPLYEVCLTEAFRTPLCTLPLNQDLSANLFESAIAQLPEFVEEWRNHRIEQVLDVIRKSSTFTNTPADEISARTILPLASTIFHCVDCNQKILYPSILVHQCLFTNSWQPKLQDFAGSLGMPTPIVPQNIELPDIPSVKDDVTLILLVRSSVRIWRGLEHRIKFDDAAHQHMLSMLDVLGWSLTTTVREMEEKQPYVECLCQCFDEARTGVKKILPRVTKQTTRRSTRNLKTQQALQGPVPPLAEPDPVVFKRKGARWMRAVRASLP
ncbi:hypothetical protein EST38_g3621 [Candolleomyces aberdarensis]|uniref:F-box domain-containing protein n=1 Tax=Candolleomyces aberdarensis TaxID=2316362 RepID=A0A4Q2DRN0_9AGAR|nr:hypothetical protein EST38_g3621 [Candolleomyces aberdarensis]